MRVFASQHAYKHVLRNLLFFSLFLFLFALVFTLVPAGIAQAATSYYISNSATGGNCTAIGIWDAATKTCTLTTDISAPAGSNGIEMISDGITLDGNGHTLSGAPGFSTGGSLTVRNNTTVKNLHITGFNYGIYLLASKSNTLTGNTYSNCNYGIYLASSTNNRVYNNNFINNVTQAQMSGGSGNLFDVTGSGGNYWSTYDTPAEGCNDNNGDFICDAAFDFAGGKDNVPFRQENGWNVTPPPDNDAPVISSVQPSGTIGVATATIRVDYNDAGSNINLSSVSVTLDGSPLSGCTADQAGVSCSVTGLSQGAHTIGGSVSDNAGNTSTISGSFSFIDSTSPVISNLSPVGTINSASVTLSAEFTDGDGAGIDQASIAVTLDGAGVGGCTVTSSTVSCLVSGLSDAVHDFGVSVMDNAGNTGTGGGTFSVDSTAPTVNNVLPAGTISTNTATISADFYDSGGIDTSSISLSLDGEALTGCAVSAVGVSCNASGLALGAHTISGSISDSAGNTSQIAGSFTFSDGTAPNVTNIQPVGTINTTLVTISASYNDGMGSGIDPVTAGVTLDGSPISGCVAGAAGLTCGVTDLTDGNHMIAVAIADLAGNIGSGSGSFTVDTAAPTITPTKYISATGGDCNSIGVWNQTTKTCTLIQDLYFDSHNGIEITSDGITLDGNGHTITGSSAFNSGGSLSLRTGITIKNLTVKNFKYGIYLMASNGNTAKNNTFENDSYGVYLASSSNNSIFNNNFVDNTTQIYVSGGSGNMFSQPAPVGGNSWSNFDMPAEGCNDANSDGFCDAPYVFTGGQDDLPLVNPLAPPADLAAPEITGVQPSGTIDTNSAMIDVYYSDSGAGVNPASVSVELDGSTLSGCAITSASASCYVYGLSEGAHAIGGSVSDMVGNTAAISGSFTVALPGTPDTTAPVVSNVEPAGTIDTGSAVISANYSDLESGIDAASVAVYLDGAVMSGCSVTSSDVSCPAEGLPNGAHTISVSVSDNAGNVGNGSGSFAVSMPVDNTAPAVTEVQPAGTTNRANATISAYFTDGDGSGIDTLSVSVNLDGAPMSGCAVTASSASCDAYGLADGAHTIGVSVADTAGNTGTGSGSFTVDTAAPAITGVTPTGTVNSAPQVVYANYSDTGSGIDTASVVVSLDGAALSGCEVGATGASCPASGLTEGPHSIIVSATDSAGNTGTGSTSFTVDSWAPGVSNILPAGTIDISSATVIAYYNDGLGTGVNTTTVTVSLDGAQMEGCTVTASSATCDAYGLADGEHTIDVSVSDMAGNTGTGSGSFTVAAAQSDTAAPTIFNVEPAGTVASKSTVISAAYSDSESGVDMASVAVYLDGVKVSGCNPGLATVSCAVGSLTEGAHAIEVNATDNAGITATGTGSFTVSTGRPPDIDRGNYVYYKNGCDYCHGVAGEGGSGGNIAGESTFETDRVVRRGDDEMPAYSEAQISEEELNDLAYAIRYEYKADDTVAPVIELIWPQGTISNDSATIAVYYHDDSWGVNSAAVSVYLDGEELTGCGVNFESASCEVYGLADGNHTISTSVSDWAGNTTSASGSFIVNSSGDTAPPVVADVQPSGTISTLSTIITAGYSDSGVGVDAASVAVYLDGSQLSGCSVAESGVSCPVSGLFTGGHNIEVNVSDRVGNAGSGTGSFTVTP